MSRSHQADAIFPGPLVVDLPGLDQAVPLRWLAGIGLLGLIETQHHPGVFSRWLRGRLQLLGPVSGPEIERFLLTRYAPSPILSPWLRSGAFGSAKGRALLGRFLASETPRLEPLRRALLELEGEALPNPLTPSSRRKRLRRELLGRWSGRNWVRAATGPEGDQSLPLLGTGGNDGRMDFAHSFLRRLVSVIPFEDGQRRRSDPQGQLRGSLYREAWPGARDGEGVGLLHPAACGGEGAPSNGLSWLYLLGLEGLVWLAGRGVDLRENITRPMPLAASAERTRSTRAVPLWTSPLTADEVVELFAYPTRSDRLLYFNLAPRNGRAHTAVSESAPPPRPNLPRFESWRNRLGDLDITDRPEIARALLTFDELRRAADARPGGANVAELLMMAGRVDRLVRARGRRVPWPRLVTEHVERGHDGRPEFRLAWALRRTPARPGCPPLIRTWQALLQRSRPVRNPLQALYVERRRRWGPSAGLRRRGKTDGYLMGLLQGPLDLSWIEDMLSTMFWAPVPPDEVAQGRPAVEIEATEYPPERAALAGLLLAGE